jgi:hypothetical protein
MSSFNQENFYIKIGNSLETILKDLCPESLEYPLRQNSIPAYVLALATMFQFQERLTDEDMVRSVRNRPEVRYGLRLAMRHPLISSSTLCRYRQLLFDDPSSFDTFQKIAGRVVEFISPDNEKTLDEKHTVPEAICLNNRTNTIISTMLDALGSLAATQPDWMREITPSYWYERYNRTSSRFAKTILEKDNEENIREIGSDIKYILDLASKDKKVADLPEIQSLRLVFEENYELSPDGTHPQRKPISCALCSRTLMQIKEAP